MKKIKEAASYFSGLFRKLFVIDDTPQKIALGLGIGVFLGIMPGTGPVAALVIAALLRANKASALIGAVLTNTWFSLVCLVLAAKIGARLAGTDWQTIFTAWQQAFRPFAWEKLFQPQFLKLALAVSLGFLAIGLCLGIFAYIAAFWAFKAHQSRKKPASRG
jgi:uncharacterized protein (DUF2062 family)